MIHILERIYDMDNDGYVSNGELFQVLKMMVGNNLKDTQLQQIVDKTILLYDKVRRAMMTSLYLIDLFSRIMMGR